MPSRKKIDVAGEINDLNIVLHRAQPSGDFLKDMEDITDMLADFANKLNTHTSQPYVMVTDKQFLEQIEDTLENSERFLSEPKIRNKTRRRPNSDEKPDFNVKIRPRTKRVRTLTEKPEEYLVGIASEDYKDGGSSKNATNKSVFKGGLKKKSKKNKRQQKRRKTSNSRF